MPNVVLRRSLLVALIAVTLAARAGSVESDAANTPLQRSGVDELRETFIELRRDIALADAVPLAPGVGQVGIYVTVDPRATATFDRVVVEADSVTAADMHYTSADLDALRRGAARAVWIGSARTLSAKFFGAEAGGKPFDQTIAIDAAPQPDTARLIEFRLAQTRTKGVSDIVVHAADANDPAMARAASGDWLLGDGVASSATVRADLEYRSVLYRLYRDRPDDALVYAVALTTLTDDPVTRGQLALAELAATGAGGARAVISPTLATADLASLEAPLRLRTALLAARAALARSDWSSLRSALAQVNAAQSALGAPSLPASVAAELGFLRAEDATADGDFDRAQAVIAAQLSPRDPERAYALFNLGVALRGAGVPSRAERVFEQVTKMPVYSDDTLDVRARARVALSALELQRTQSASAEEVLRDAPASGRYREQFLAAYGARAMQHGDYPLAARIWLTLARESPWSAVGKTAWVAYPMCLEHIAAPDVALAQYRDAEARFERRIVDLDALLARTRDPIWDRGLVDVLARDPDPTLRRDPTLTEWRDRVGNDDWLVWLNAGATRSALQDLAYLDRISAWLAAGVPSAFESRARSLAAATARAANDRRAVLAREIAAIAANEVSMAQQQLRLIRIGIARTSDGAAQPPVVGATQ